MAWRPGLAGRSPGWRGAPLAQTDSERARADARLHRHGGPAGVQGQGGGGREKAASETLNPGKVQGLCRYPRGRRGARRSSAPLCWDSETWEERGAAQSCCGLAEPLSILLRLRPGGWSRRPGQEGLGSGALAGFPAPSFLQASSPWGSPFRPRDPHPSRGAVPRAGGAEPACEEPGPWSRLERARWPSSELSEGTSRWPSASGIPSRRRLGWWQPASAVSSLHGNFFFSRWIKVAWIFSFFAKEIIYLHLTWDFYAGTAAERLEERTLAIYVGLLPKPEKLGLALEICTLERVRIRAGPRSWGILHSTLGRPRDAGGHRPRDRTCGSPLAAQILQGAPAGEGGGSFRPELRPHQLRGCSRRRLGRPLPSKCPRIALLGPQSLRRDSLAPRPP